MTEEEWLHIQSRSEQHDFARAISERKFRLFSVACCRRAWAWMIDPRSRNAIETVERFVDGRVSREVCEASAEEAFQAELDIGDVAEHRAYSAATFAAYDAANLEEHGGWQAVGSALQVATDAAGYPPSPNNAEVRRLSREAEYKSQHALMLDIFGNPFRPVAFASEWRTSATTALAAAMYESRDFGAMPVLADALEEAGCDHADVLAHCRDADGVHVRGCWVVDHVLGKQ